MPTCKYRLCDVEVEQPKNRTGRRLEYCCRRHGKAERQYRCREKLAKVEAEQEQRNIKGKQFATINCLRWLDCLSVAARNKCEVKCLGCEKIEIQTNAYRMELGTEMFSQDA